MSEPNEIKEIGVVKNEIRITWKNPLSIIYPGDPLLRGIKIDKPIIVNTSTFKYKSDEEAMKIFTALASNKSDAVWHKLRGK